MISANGESYYSKRSIYGIHQAYCIETNLILTLQEEGVKNVFIRHIGGGANACKIFMIGLDKFIDCRHFIPIRTPYGELQRAIKFVSMKEISEKELGEYF